MGQGSLGWLPPGTAMPRGRTRSTSVGAVVLGAVISLVATAGTASAHAAGSAHPDEWDRLMWIVLILGTIVAIVVYALIVLAIYRYRESSPYVRKEPSVHNPRLETVWTIIPVILVVIVIVLSMQVLSTTEDIPEEGIRIQVVGRQFEWLFTYPDNTTTVNDVWVEEGQIVIFEIWATDVIHSFFLPDFRLKVDAFPNYVDEAYIVAEPVGDYQIVCAEFCGDIHSEMLGTLHIYEKGLHDKPYGPPPGEVPPPPEVEEVKVDIELREDGGPGTAAPWSVRPSLIEVPMDAEVSFRVWNNGTEAHGFYLAAPYDLTIAAIPPGEFAYLNFTADMPTRGILAYCPDDDHRVRGMKASMVVEQPPQTGGPDTVDERMASAGILYGLGLLLLGVVLAVALREPKGAKHEDHEVEVEDHHEEFHVAGGDEDVAKESATDDGPTVEEGGEEA